MAFRGPMSARFHMVSSYRDLAALLVIKVQGCSCTDSVWQVHRHLKLLRELNAW